MIRKSIPIHFFSWVILVVVLVGTIHCGHEGTHAAPGKRAITGSLESALDLSADHQCPYAPLEHQTEDDGCDCCVNCACHAPLMTQPLLARYNPVIRELQPLEPFKLLPEVYLPKFIPPQNQA